MKKILKFSAVILAVLLLTCCGKIAGRLESSDIDMLWSELKPQENKEAMKVEKLEFSPDYKTFVVTTRMYDDIGPYSLTDSSKVRIEIEETIDGILKSRRSMPRLLENRNLKGEHIRECGAKVLVLVDATLPQESLNRIKSYVTELRAVFNSGNLYVAFMQGSTLGDTMEVTDYVLENLFKHWDYNYTFLYRFILQKRNEMMSYVEPWVSASKKVLLIFSDERIYNEVTDMPIDPAHYQLEEELARINNDPNSNFIASYASVKSGHSASAYSEINVLKQFCQNTNGIYMDKYSGTNFKNNILSAYGISPDANQFTFVNPDGKVYRGSFETLTVKFRDAATDSVVTSFSTDICEGDIYNPIIVHGLSLPLVVAQGILLGLFIALLSWFLFQFVIPYVRYRYFLKKYVVRYSKGKVGLDSAVVSESCYLCKQPFETGEEIVVKCNHTMHKTCWDENEYHCPEYSDRCKHGSHYYNSTNMLDKRNASPYMKWVIMAIISATIAWVVFIIREHTFTKLILSKVLFLFYGLPEGSLEAENILASNTISPLPAFGFTIAFFLTLGISIMATSLRNVRYNPGHTILRALIAAFGSYLVFLLANFLVIITDIKWLDLLIEWIPWTLSGLIIAYCSTYKTRIVLRKSLLMLGIGLGILSMYFWWLFSYTDIDYRVLLLLSFIIFAVGLTIGIATVAPRSERYFLKVEGAVKTMDIALYKWFKNAPYRVVSIGKSVDCSLQLSWDMLGDVAPVHAEIYLKQDAPYLVALEDGVYVSGEPLEIGKEIWLHHGKSFSIGNTTFTFIEKDLTPIS